MSDAAQTLNEAYELIEQGDLAAARQLLDEIRPENENNPDFWWVYAHAVESPEEGRQALNRVRDISPNYPDADVLAQKAGLSTPPPPIQSLRPAPVPPSLPDMPLEDFDDDLDEIEFDGDEETEGGNQRRNLMFAIVGVIAVVIIAVLVVPNFLGGGTATPTPTISAIVSTLPATLPALETTTGIDITEDVGLPTTEETTEAIEVETDVATEPAEDNGYAELAAELSQFDVPANGIETDETVLGNTLLVSTCAVPGPAASRSILNIVESLKDQPLAEDIEAIAFRVTRCSDETVVRLIAISRGDFDDYAQDTITVTQLQQRLRPIG
jgi:hypothetical protein